MWLVQIVFFFPHLCLHSLLSLSLPLSIFLSTCLLIFFLCSSAPLSTLIYDAMKQNVTVNFFRLLYSPQTYPSPLRSSLFYIFSFCFLLLFRSSVFSSCRFFLLPLFFLLLPSLSRVLFLPSVSLTRFIFSSNYSTHRRAHTAARTHTTFTVRTVMLVGAAVPLLCQWGSLWHCDRAVERRERQWDTLIYACVSMILLDCKLTWRRHLDMTTLI